MSKPKVGRMIEAYLKKHAISQTDFAKRCRVTQGMIWQWINGTRPIPAKRVLTIEAASDGELSRHKIRADIYPLGT